MKLFKRREIKINESKYKVGDSVKYYINKTHGDGFVLRRGKIIKIKDDKYFISSDGTEGIIIKEDEVICKAADNSYDKKGEVRFVFECPECKTISNVLKRDGLAVLCPKCNSDRIIPLKVVG